MLRPFLLKPHFSLLFALRCEIQAVDQHWTQHRLAIDLVNGKSDSALPDQLEGLSPWNYTAAFEWPVLRPEDYVSTLLNLKREAAPLLQAIQKRQSEYLERELRRIDRFFNDYVTELTIRLGRTQRDETRARLEHESRQPGRNTKTAD